MRSSRTLLILSAPFAFAACAVDSPLSPVPGPAVNFAVVSAAASSQGVITAPFLLEFDDFNPCNGALEHFVFEGTSRLQSFADHSVLHISGTVTTDDGWVGKFNRDFVSQGTELTWRFLDMEVGPDNQRQMFTSNLHGELVDGQIVWSVRNPSLKCIGKPAAA